MPRFGVFEVDLSTGEVFRSGRRVALQRQPFLILAALLERPGTIVSRDELRERLWSKDTFVDFDHGLATAVKKLRGALQDDAQNPVFIETVGGRGFRFIAPVDVTSPASPRLVQAAPIADEPLARTRSGLAAAALLTVATLAAFAWLRYRSAPPPPAIHVNLSVPASAPLVNVRRWDSTLAISPDGRRVVYAAWTGDGVGLFERTLDALDARPISGGEGGSRAFFSPDGAWLGFAADGKLRRMPVDGGPSTVLADAPRLHGASWGADDSIVFAPDLQTGLFRIPAAGGTPSPLTRLAASAGEISHRWPQVLPGGEAALFSSVAERDGTVRRALEAVVLATGERRVLVPGAAYARYVPGDRLVFVRDQSLFVIGFDPRALRVIGSERLVAEPAELDGDMAAADEAHAYLDVSASGTLAYLRRLAPEKRLLWVTRDGQWSPASRFERPYDELALSPDGERVAALVASGHERALWVGDLRSDHWSRLAWGGPPAWSADGSRLLREHAQAPRVTWSNLEGDREQPVNAAAGVQGPAVASPDDRHLAYVVQDASTGLDIWGVDLSGRNAGRPWPLAATVHHENLPSFSPDGRYVAYQVCTSPRDPGEIYVQPFAKGAARVQVSRDGGQAPRWSRDGREIFFRRGGGELYSVSIRTEPKLTAGVPTRLFRAAFPWRAQVESWDAAPSGQRFLVIANREEGPPQLVLVPNWTNGL